LPNSWGGVAAFAIDSKGNDGIRADKGLKNGQSAKKIEKGIEA
jgi:hypothetical protein